MQGSANPGINAMCIVEDAGNGTPTTLSIMMTQRLAQLTNNTNDMHINYRPQHNRWLWTDDRGGSDDRLEFPGTLHIASQFHGTNSVPGQFYIHFDISFDTLTAVETSLIKNNILHLPSKDEERTKRIDALLSLLGPENS